MANVIEKCSSDLEQNTAFSNTTGLRKKRMHRKPQASKLCANLRTLMSEFPKLNVSRLAELTGLGQPVVHRLFSGETDNPKVLTLSSMAKFFGVTISALIGDEPLPDSRLRGSYSQNVQPYQHIPVLSWSQVLVWPELPEADSHIPTLLTNLDIGRNGYAVTVTDTTMEPRFPEGTRLLMNPELSPRNRDFVIIQIEGEELPHFKQLLIDGNNYYLKPFNPDFRAFLLDKPYRLLGTMVEAQWVPVGYPVKLAKESEQF